MRLLTAMAISLSALACTTGSDCPETAPLDCGEGGCCPTATPYGCPNLDTCYSIAQAAYDACTESAVQCTGSDSSGGGNGTCAHWSCGSSSQCVEVMGAQSGVQCQFEPGQTCAEWCAIYIPGNCTCKQG